MFMFRGFTGLVFAALLFPGLLVSGCSNDPEVVVSSSESADTPASSDEAAPAPPAGEVFLEPVGSHGPEPFTGELFVTPVDLAGAEGLEPEPVPAAEAETEAIEVQGRTGDAPGLYGGTQDNTQCDADGILAFSSASPTRQWRGPACSTPTQR